MYVDASEACLTMNFHLGESSTTFQRTWNVRVTQFKCDYENLAPSGCTQYYFNPEGDEGVVTTYNYNNGAGMHLAQQRQTICIRYMRNCIWKKDWKMPKLPNLRSLQFESIIQGVPHSPI